MALRGRIMTLKLVILSSSFQEMMSTAFIETPSIEVCSSNTDELESVHSRKYTKLGLSKTRCAAYKYFTVFALPSCGVCTTGDSNITSSARHASKAASFPVEKKLFQLETAIGCMRFPILVAGDQR